MRGPLAHFRELRRWIRWRWENRPRLRIRLPNPVAGFRQRRAWQRANRDDKREAVAERRAKTKPAGFLHGTREWLRWKWENRPEFRLKWMNPSAEYRQWRKWRRENRKDRLAGSSESRTRRGTTGFLNGLREWIRWRWENRPDFKIKVMNPVAEFRQWRAWQLQNRPDAIEAALERKQKKKNPAWIFVEGGKFLRWHLENRPVGSVVMVLFLVAGTALAIHLGGGRNSGTQDVTALAGETGDWAEAERAAREKLERGGAIDSLRQLVKAAREKQDPHALAFAKRLFKHPDATRDDQLGVLVFALESSDVETSGAGELLQALPLDAIDTLELPHLLPLSAWLSQQGDLDRLFALSRRLLQEDPDNPDLINSHHFRCALHGQPDPQSQAELRRLVEASPRRPEFRGTLALVLLRSGDPAAALAVLGPLEAAPDRLPTRVRAIYAAVLTAAELHAEAESLATEIDWSDLPLAEANILRSLGRSPENSSGGEEAVAEDDS